jgi:hypothetical protein
MASMDCQRLEGRPAMTQLVRLFFLFILLFVLAGMIAI